MTDLRPILLVEDDLDDIELTLAALRQNNLANEVVVARHGAEALDYLHRRGKFQNRSTDDPIVVFLDLKMPKVDGMAFFRELSAKMPHIVRRVIFVTGDVAGTEAERFLDESGCRWLAKPFRLRDLVKTAREILS